VEEERLRLGDGRPGRRRLTRAGRRAKAKESGRMAAGEGSGATGNSARLGLVRIRDGLGKGRVVAVACWTDWGRGKRQR
jgi:hypothetical protein